MELLSQRGYARHRKELGLRGTTHTSVQKAIRTGRISTVDGKIDPESADREWSDSTDASLQREPTPVIDEAVTLRVAERLQRSGRRGAGGNGGGNGSGISVGVMFSEARARREQARAEIAELDLQERLGELVRADEVKLAAFNSARHARDVLIALTPRVAPALHAAGTVEEIQRLLADEVETVCRELSSHNEIPKSERD